MTRRLLEILLPPLAVLVASMAIAEILCRLGEVPSWLIPPPSQVLEALQDRWDALGPALLSTAGASVAGFAASGAAGILLALVFSAGSWAQRAFYPYAIFFQTVPVVAIAPLLVIWFGYGFQTVVASTFIVSVFPVIANTLTGLLSTDLALRDLFRLYGAPRWATLWKLHLPSALPGILTGLRVAAGLAVIGAIVGEFFAGVGLGIQMKAAIQEQRADVVFASILLASLLGVALFSLVNTASYFALRRWHASEQGRSSPRAERGMTDAPC
ncbi:MAG: ABC transporter permease [Planctomycetota bacterium]